MSEILKNVSITQKANVYFDGAVTSRSLELADGRTLTLGFMQAGSYTFNTQAPELMTAIAGEAEVRLAGCEEPFVVREGQHFESRRIQVFKSLCRLVALITVANFYNRNSCDCGRTVCLKIL